MVHFYRIHNMPIRQTRQRSETQCRASAHLLIWIQRDNFVPSIIRGEREIEVEKNREKERKRFP